MSVADRMCSHDIRHPMGTGNTKVMLQEASVLLIVGILLTFPASLAAGSGKCLNDSDCSGEGEFCSDDAVADTPGDSSPGMRMCECWNSYFKNESGGCYKPIFYDLRLRVDNRGCTASEITGSQSVNCTHRLAAQLIEYLNHSMRELVTLELISLHRQQQQQSLDVLTQQGSRSGEGHHRMAAPAMSFVRVLAVVKAQLKTFDGICLALENDSNATVHCNGSMEYAAADVLCHSQLGNPCDAASAECHPSGSVPLCKCRKGYRSVPGNRWTCIARCSPSEHWDESLKSCKAKCQATSCQNSGECFPTADGHVCRCMSGYEGIDCSHWSGRKYEELKWVTVGIGIATLLLTLMLVAVVSIACCTDKCQKIVFGHRQLNPTEDLERLSCFSATARSVLKDYDTGKDTIEMTRQSAKGQLPKKYCAHPEARQAAKADGHCVLDDEKKLAGINNESYIPEANYDLDAAEEKSLESVSQNSSDN